MLRWWRFAAAAVVQCTNAPSTIHFQFKSEIDEGNKRVEGGNTECNGADEPTPVLVHNGLGEEVHTMLGQNHDVQPLTVCHTFDIFTLPLGPFRQPWHCYTANEIPLLILKLQYLSLKCTDPDYCSSCYRKGQVHSFHGTAKCSNENMLSPINNVRRKLSENMVRYKFARRKPRGAEKPKAVCEMQGLFT